jgi:ankyrin repeat protein
MENKNNIIRILQQHKTDFNITILRKWTPLYIIYFHNYKNIVKILLENNNVLQVANINIKTSNNKIPLYIIAQRGHKESVLDLLDRSIIFYISNTNRWTLLYTTSICKKMDIVELLMHNYP